MAKRIYSFVLLSLLGLGACRQSPRIEEVLTAKNGQFWDMQYADRPVHYAYRFYTNGKCFRYVLNRNGTLSLYDGDDIVLPNKWNVAGDTLMLDALPLYVARFTADSVFLKHRINPIKLVLVKASERPIEVH